MKKSLFYLSLLILGYTSQAQESLNYQTPPKEILDLADYERAPSVSMDSKKENILLSYTNTYKSLEELNQVEMKLGGLRINPTTNISSTVTYINNLKLSKIKNGTPKQIIGLPENAKITNISWSPDEKKIAFTNTTSKGVELWVVDIATVSAKKLTSDNLNANLGNPINWFRDSNKLLIKVLPKNRETLINNEKEIPTGPIISETSGGTSSQNRTFQDLLKNKIDEANFEILTTSELHIVDLNGDSKLYKEAAIYSDESFSPNGNYIKLTTINKPFSYVVPYYRFPQTETVYDTKGILVKEINNVPLDEIRAKGFMSTRAGKRGFSWRPDEPSTLYFTEALDDGDANKEVEFRDEVYLWKAPFNETPKSFVKTKLRFSGITWGNKETAIYSEYWYDTRTLKGI